MCFAKHRCWCQQLEHLTPLCIEVVLLLTRSAALHVSELWPIVVWCRNWNAKRVFFISRRLHNESVLSKNKCCGLCNIFRHHQPALSVSTPLVQDRLALPCCRDPHGTYGSPDNSFFIQPETLAGARCHWNCQRIWELPWWYAASLANGTQAEHHSKSILFRKIGPEWLGIQIPGHATNEHDMQTFYRQTHHTHTSQMYTHILYVHNTYYLHIY